MNAHWLLYSYDALGLGHVRRMLAIPRAVLATRADISALLITCSPQVDALPVPPGLDYIKLPSARKLAHRHYVPRTLRLGSDQLRRMRSCLLRNAAREFNANFLLVDKSPLGLMGELRETLEDFRARRGVSLVLGWRDILDEPAKLKAEWEADGTLEAVERHYDEIWVYGDPTVYDVRKEYALPDAIAERVRYLGYLAPEPDPEAREAARARFAPTGARLAVVTAGGGEDGERLMATYLEAASRRLLPNDLHSLVVLGPFLPFEAQRRLSAAAPASCTIVSFVPGLETILAAADLVVAQAGYNTASELLGAGTPAVLVPRVLHRTEQQLRSRRLAALGLVEHVDMTELTPATLSLAARKALQRAPRAVSLRLNGLSRVVQEVERLLPRGGPVEGAVPDWPLAARSGGWMSSPRPKTLP